MAKTLEYKGHPLQRKDNIIYYGSFADKYIIMLQIMETILQDRGCLSRSFSRSCRGI